MILLYFKIHFDLINHVLLPLPILQLLIEVINFLLFGLKCDLNFPLELVQMLLSLSESIFNGLHFVLRHFSSFVGVFE